MVRVGAFRKWLASVTLNDGKKFLMHSSAAFSNDIMIDLSLLFRARMSPEWRQKIYLPNEPFNHSELLKLGRLRYFTSLFDPSFQKEFKTPCVMIASEPCLRNGDAVYFLKLWSDSAKNTVILTGTHPCVRLKNPQDDIRYT
jgi:hypothetical protein